MVSRTLIISMAIGIIALVILFGNYQIMHPIAQQQYTTFKNELYACGLQGDFENYGSIEEAMRSGGLQFSYEWQRLYDAYNLTMTEISVVSIICIATAVLSFSYAVTKIRRKP